VHDKKTQRNTEEQGSVFSQSTPNGLGAQFVIRRVVSRPLQSVLPIAPPLTSGRDILSQRRRLTAHR
jgi:hypothetical protein